MLELFGREDLKGDSMKVFDWLFKKKNSEKEIRKGKALKIYEEVEDLIEIYYNQLIKGRSYSQDVCIGLRNLYCSQLKRDLEFYLEFPKQSMPFEDKDEVFNRVVSKVSNQFNKILRKY